MPLQEGPRSRSASSLSALRLSFGRSLGAGIPQSLGQGSFPEKGCPEEEE